MTLAPAFQAYLDELNPQIAANAAKGVEPTVEGARAALASLNQFALPSVPVAAVHDRAVTYASASGEVVVPVRVYVPSPQEATDVILFVHGGGHMGGDLDVYDFSARRTAAATGMVTVSVDYRLAPEYPYPNGLEDTYAVLHNLGQVLGDVRTTGVIHAVADSGGAAVVSSIAMRVAAGEWQSPISRQVLIYPSLDYTLSGKTIETYGTGYFLEANRVAWYFDNYFAGDVNREAASPVTGPFNAGMPHTLVIAAEYDPLLSEAETYVGRMQQAGAAADLIIAPGMIHAYAFFETLVPDQTERTYEVIAEFLRDGHATW